MDPWEGCDLGEQFVGNDDTVTTDIIDGTAEIDGVPQDDGIDDEVEAGRAISHGFGDAVAQFAELMEEDGACEGMAAFALVEDGVRPAAQFGVEQPVADEDRGACRKPCSRLRLPRERWHFHALLTF